MTISGGPHEFTIQADEEYLEENIQAFYHVDYVGMNNPGNPNYVNTLKNTFSTFSRAKLNNAVQELRVVLENDLPDILDELEVESVVVCVVPRARTDYTQEQVLFKSTVKSVIEELDGFYDGTGYISRHTQTQTTHLKNATNLTNYNNDGPEPYPGITKDTCTISKNVSQKDILLIDDIYTHDVKIDEDAIQALLDSGANSVVFYAIGKC